MTDPTIDDPGQQSDPGQQNAVTDHWYDSFAGDDPARQEQLSKFDSFDSFLEDYNAAKNADWRDGIAGDDDKFKSTLQRFSTPQDFGNSYREAQQKIRSGQLRPELPEDASEEQIKEYRQANNIPIEVEGYLENLPDGLVVGDEDKEIMLDFLGAMHEVNAPKAVADKMVAWYNDFEQRQQDAIAELDAEQAREATDMLRDSENGWGNDFRTNMNLINSVLETHFGEEAKAQLLNGRYQDGRGFFNDPNVLKGLASLARAVNDVAPLIAQDPNKLKALDDEIAEIENVLATDRARYNKDTKMQTRYNELLELRLQSQKGQNAA